PSSARIRSILSLACSVSDWLSTRAGADRAATASRPLTTGAAAIAAHPYSSRSLKNHILHLPRSRSKKSLETRRGGDKETGRNDRRQSRRVFVHVSLSSPRCSKACKVTLRSLRLVKVFPHRIPVPRVQLAIPGRLACRGVIRPAGRARGLCGSLFVWRGLFNRHNFISWLVGHFLWGA